MSNPVFQVKNLHCGYQPGQVVLNVQELSLPAGQLVFIVGVSGGGKSTFIETLGLMNETTRHDGLGGQITYYTHDGEEHDLLKLWDRGDKYLSTFRQHQFSFIFQQTNLMPNFSAGENMLITALFAGEDVAKAEKKVRALMEKIDLPPRAFDAEIQELSGGQRQRLAFIRALVADFQVLFGDEPTGNLDNATARECFQVLRDEIHATGKTAIIVTHDLPIAVEFGDQIIPISLRETSQGKLQGVTDDKLMLFRGQNKEMQKRNGTVVADPVTYLEENIFNPG